MARPEHEPTDQTRAEVAALASFGVPQEAIGEYIGVSHPTLRKHYAAELSTAVVKANAQVGRFLFRAASGQALNNGDGATFADCTRAAMFWAKTRMGWRETTVVAGDAENPIEVNHNGSAKLLNYLDAIAGRVSGE